MKNRIVKKPGVERDLIEHFAFIARDKLEPAERFLKVVEEAFERIGSMPKIGRIWESHRAHLMGIRVYPMPSGFRNYLVFYREIEGGVEIISVLHGARDVGAAMDILIGEEKRLEEE